MVFKWLKATWLLWKPDFCYFGCHFCFGFKYWDRFQANFRTKVNHLNTWLVRYSDDHCIYNTVGIWKPDMSGFWMVDHVWNSNGAQILNGVQFFECISTTALYSTVQNSDIFGFGSPLYWCTTFFACQSQTSMYNVYVPAQKYLKLNKLFIKTW